MSDTPDTIPPAPEPTVVPVESTVPAETSPSVPPEPAPTPADSAAAPAEEQSPAQQPQPRTRVVAIANQKGGVGKTTTVINLATCLVQLGQRVLVIDLDPQTNATSGLGVAAEDGVSMYPAMLGGAGVETLIRKTVVEGLDLIPSEIDLAGAEIEIARTDSYLHCFKRAMTPLVEANLYDLILIDCPPSLGILTANALAAADSVLIPVQCEYYALEGLSKITRLIQQLRDKQANSVIEIEGIVMTMFDGRVNLSTDVIKEVNKFFGDTVFNTVIPRNVRLSEAPSFGKPAVVYDRTSAGAQAYRALAEEFLKRRGIAFRRARGDAPYRRIPIFKISVISNEHH
jgi:chromosome partitioning protein